MAANELATIGYSSMNMIIITGIIVVVVALIAWGAWFFMNWKKYQDYMVCVFHKNGEDKWCLRFDKGGVFVNKKTNTKRMWMKKSRSSLQADRIPFLPKNRLSFMDYTFGVIFVVQKADGSYAYIDKWNIDENGLQVQVSGEDLNWGLTAFDEIMRHIENKFFKDLMLVISIVVVGIIILIMVIISVKDMTHVAELLANAMSTASANMKEFAASMAQANSGTTVIQGG